MTAMNEDDHSIHLQGMVPAELGGERCDAIASHLFPDYSRSRLQGWLKDGRLTVDGEPCKPKTKLLPGQLLVLEAELEPQGEWLPEDIPLDIVYEDHEILVVNKPAGMVVHPGAGNWSGTLLNGLLHHYPDIDKVPRAGIVHRLDKDTTGLMVVAKTLQAQTDLVMQLQDRTVSREYAAVVTGTFTGGGTVDAPIGRHPQQRTKMAVLRPTANGAKEAITHYWIEQRFPQHTLVRVKLETGRTHQIRVHMTHLGHSLVGDGTYSRFKIPKGASPELVEALRSFPRQALHARKLGLEHPGTGDYMEWEVPLPEDIQALINALEEG